MSIGWFDVDVQSCWNKGSHVDQIGWNCVRMRWSSFCWFFIFLFFYSHLERLEVEKEVYISNWNKKKYAKKINKPYKTIWYRAVSSFLPFTPVFHTADLRRYK